jgi:hypothetical protein
MVPSQFCNLRRTVSFLAILPTNNLMTCGGMR